MNSLGKEFKAEVLDEEEDDEFLKVFVDALIKALEESEIKEKEL